MGRTFAEILIKALPFIALYVMARIFWDNNSWWLLPLGVFLALSMVAYLAWAVATGRIETMSAWRKRVDETARLANERNKRRPE